MSTERRRRGSADVSGKPGARLRSTFEQMCQTGSASWGARGSDFDLFRTRTAAARALADWHDPDVAQHDTISTGQGDTAGDGTGDRDALFDAVEDAAELDRDGLPAPLAAALDRLAAARDVATGDGPVADLQAAARSVVASCTRDTPSGRAADAVARLAAVAAGPS